MSFMDNFPGTPRGGQEEVINRIENAFVNNGKKFVICQAPTGSGKSHIGATVASSTKRCSRALMRSRITPKSHFKVDVDLDDQFGGFVLTTTKQLQDQYATLFPHISTLKGKHNYSCSKDLTLNAGCASCVYIGSEMDKCSIKGDCDYINAYSDAVKSSFSVLNYPMYLSLPSSLRYKQVLVCDEASELEDALVSQFSINVNYKTLDYLGVHYSPLYNDTSEAGFLWISELLINLKFAMPTSKRLMRKNVPKTVTDKARQIRNLTEKIRLLHNNWNVCEFIVMKTKDGVSISPLKVNALAKLMFSGIDKVLLLSATIINHAKFAENLGIGKEDYEFIDVDSEFDPKKSPIYTAPATFDMGYKKVDASLPKLIDSIVELCDIHKADNGIIHTQNFKITKAIQNAVGGDPRFLFRDKFATNADILNEHYNNPRPTVLVSPSLAFGTSLDNEYGRFQIITKLPYLPMSDKRIKTLMNRDSDWYQMRMWIKLIQMSGRCTRSIDDHSATYIFDKGFIGAIGRYESKLPKWFKDRLI